MMCELPEIKRSWTDRKDTAARWSYARPCCTAKAARIMVTLTYENEDVASLPSFEKKGELR